MRPDLEIIAEVIKPGARVLDLGCGEGELLAYLQTSKQVNGYGLEIDPDNITTCLHNGVNVIEQDLDEGLDNFPDDSFDLVVMTETLQAVQNPDRMLDDMLRIGGECIVTFPNFGYWKNRLQVVTGHMPVSDNLPYQWFDTPNVHLCTIADFDGFCRERGVRVLERKVLTGGRPVGFWRNFLGALAVYRFGS